MIPENEQNQTNHGMQRSGDGAFSGEINVDSRRPLIPDVRWKRKYHMADREEEPKGTFASALGSMVALITRDLGAAVAMVGGLWAGFATIAAAQRSTNSPWPLYLIGGAIFVALLVVCRWRGRN